MADHKRSPEADLPAFDDPADVVNAVISTLHVPDEPTNVSAAYANDKNVATEVQAYAKIAGRDWTFYVKTLAVAIGRNTDAPPPPRLLQMVEIDLGPAKVVSRQHAAITYNIDLRCWELKVLGRNGARIDGVKMPVGPLHATPLHSGAILDIGGTQMMFILPDTPPSILQKMLAVCLARYKDGHKMPRLSRPAPTQAPQNVPYNNFSNVASFQMYEKGQLAHSPAVSAVSLQSNLDQDLSKEDSKDIKPPYSYATMITQAILSNSDGVMSLSEIYNWISSHYAYYKYSKTGWQNSIRHNLLLNKAFEKTPRKPNEPGKGMKWQISEAYRNDFLKKVQTGTLLKSRRGSSVSRTLQIHLATHQGLPENKSYVPENKSYVPEKSYAKPDNGSYAAQQKPPAPKNQALPYPMMPMAMHNYSVPQHAYQMPYNMQYQRPMMNNLPGAQALMPQEKPLELISPMRNSTHDKAQNGMFSLHQANGSNGAAAYPPSVNLYKAASNLMDNSAIENGAANSFNSSAVPHTSESLIQNSTATSAPNTSELGLAFTSPKKIAPLEAFTPERGSKSGNYGRSTNQSSPAFWNFVQFSTPNEPTPGRKNSDESNGQGSPTLKRGFNGKNNSIPYNDSPSEEGSRAGQRAKT